MSMCKLVEWLALKQCASYVFYVCLCVFNWIPVRFFSSTFSYIIFPLLPFLLLKSINVPAATHDKRIEFSNAIIIIWVDLIQFHSHSFVSLLFCFLILLLSLYTFLSPFRNIYSCLCSHSKVFENVTYAQCVQCSICNDFALSINANEEKIRVFLMISRDVNASGIIIIIMCHCICNKSMKLSRRNHH